MLPLPREERTGTVGLGIVKLGVLKHLLHVLQSTSLLLGHHGATELYR